MDGESDNEGKVEICIDGIWMTADTFHYYYFWFVHYYWTYTHAKIVCRQLGYYDICKINNDSNHFNMLINHAIIGSVPITDIVWNNNTRVSYRYELCYGNGNDKSLDSCSKYYPSKYLNSWYNNMRAGVECQMKSQSGMTYCIYNT